jgi:hypothetical protein
MNKLIKVLKNLDYELINVKFIAWFFVIQFSI